MTEELTAEERAYWEIPGSGGGHLLRLYDAALAEKQRLEAAINEACWSHNRTVDGLTKERDAALARAEAADMWRAAHPTPERTIEPDEPLYVCPGCLAIGDEDCSAGCPDRAFADERRRAQREDESEPFDLNESFDWSTEP